MLYDCITTVVLAWLISGAFTGNGVDLMFSGFGVLMASAWAIKNFT